MVASTIQATAQAQQHLLTALRCVEAANAAAQRADSWRPWRARAAQREASAELRLAIDEVTDAVHLTFGPYIADVLA